MAINLIYFGSPHFSAAILGSLLTSPPLNLNISAVITNPDKYLGRHQTLTPSPVAQIAKQHHLPIFKPRQLDSAHLSHLKLLKPDLFLVAAYGKIIPSNWLALPTIAALNLHFSLLPKYRGALCIQTAIKNLDQQTGVTLMEMDEELDHGPIIAQSKQRISANDDCATLTDKLTKKAIQLIKVTLPAYSNWRRRSITPSPFPKNLYLPPKPQQHRQASYTPAVNTCTRANAYIPWKTVTAAVHGRQAAHTHALIRSLNPNPGAWTKINRQEIKIISTSLKDNLLHILSIQLPGKKPVNWQQFTTGHQINL